MGEVGCLKDGHFQNLEVESTTILENLGETITVTSGNTLKPELILQNTHNSNGLSSILTFQNKRDNQTLGDSLGTINFKGKDSANNEDIFASIVSKSTAIASTSEIGEIGMSVATSGTGALAEVVNIKGGTSAADSTVTIPASIISPSICHMGYAENTTAFVTDDISNVEWSQPAGTILKNIYLFVVSEPTIVSGATSDLGYIVGNTDNNGSYVAAVTNGLIGAAGNPTALKEGAFLHVATRDIGTLGASGPVARLLPIPETFAGTAIIADGNYAETARNIFFGTSATLDASVSVAGTVRWLIEYIQVV